VKALALLAAAAVLVLGLLAQTAVVIATHPWLAVKWFTGPPTIRVPGAPPGAPGGVPGAAPGGVPPDQWPLILQAAQGSRCGVRPEDLAAIAKTESGFGRNVGPNPRSGAVGYGQFMPGTFAAEGGTGDPTRPADALPVMAKMLCEKGYGSNRTRALNSYGGCVTPTCLGDTDYATEIDKRAAAYRVPAALPAEAAPSEHGAQVVALARTWLGTRYVLGGCSRAGIDCSCLVQIVYRQVGVGLPRVAADQWNATQRIDRDQLQPGDLVFFRDTYEPGISHVGIYEGGGMMVNASDEKTGTVEAAVFSGYWLAHYAGAGRVRP
jgi:NlpC/P60 family/Transglycosylase SLT domain